MYIDLELDALTARVQLISYSYRLLLAIYYLIQRTVHPLPCRRLPIVPTLGYPLGSRNNCIVMTKSSVEKYECGWMQMITPSGELRVRLCGAL